MLSDDESRSAPLSQLSRTVIRAAASTSRSDGHAKLRLLLAILVALSLLAYIVLLIWGIGTKAQTNTSEVIGLPTVSDMLAGNLAITIFYVIVICLYGEIRAMWAVAHLMNTQNPLMVEYLMQASLCCGYRIGVWLLILTSAIMVFGLAQVVLLLIIAVVPIQPPVNGEIGIHVIVAVSMTCVSVIHAALLTTRRESVYMIFKKAGKVNFCQIFDHPAAHTTHDGEKIHTYS